MANAANVRNIKSSKSRQYAQDRNKFGGSSASKSTSKTTPDYSDKTLRPSADTSGQPKSYDIKSTSKPKTTPDYSDKTLRSSSDTSGQPSKYSAESAPKSAQKTQYGLKEASPRANAVTAKTGNIGAAAKTAGRVLSRGLGAASLALEPGNLSDDETPYSKKPDDSYSVTSAKDRAAELLGNPKVSTSKAESAPKAESMPKAKESPKAVIKKTTVTAVKPSKSVPRESDSSRASRMAAYENWAKTNRDPMTSDYLGTAEDENAYTKSVAGENSDGYRKGGMTNRKPPKPAKKAPAKRFASGGSTSRTSASKRGDGCATKGHTKGKYL